MSAAASAARTIDWTALSAKLKPETVAAVSAFRRRHADLTKTVAELREQLAPIDFARYRSVLKNSRIVDEAERAAKAFRPASYDLTEQLRIIKEQETKAVAAAQLTASKVNAELLELNELLTHIETARPIEQLTTEDVVKALPEIDTTVEKMSKRGQWRVPGYYEKFGEFIVGF
ncbi:hypothetical protein BC831DRAFT_476852 [Entophlyctis helioformis]|nr:hypothetical protein BC831DRAFT_476852 [Entophlyctis helioformis]